MLKRIIITVALGLALANPATAVADHGHNCVYSGGAWVGQGLCPGMPGYTPHTDPPEPAPEPEPEPEPTTTIPSPAPAPSTAPPPAPPPPPATTPPPPAPAPNRTPGCLRSYGNEWCTGATPSTSTTTPAPVVGPLVETDIVLYAPEVNPARILR